jgi:hypothetical protein
VGDDHVQPRVERQIPPASGGDRVRLVTFPGGHMFYSRDDSRAGLRSEAAKLMGAAP